MRENCGFLQQFVHHHEPFQEQRLHIGRWLRLPVSERADEDTYKIWRDLAGWIQIFDELDTIGRAQVLG